MEKKFINICDLIMISSLLSIDFYRSQKEKFQFLIVSYVSFYL